MDDLGKSGLGVQKHRISCQNITMRVRMCIPAVLIRDLVRFPAPKSDAFPRHRIAAGRSGLKGDLLLLIPSGLAALWAVCWKRLIPSERCAPRAPQEQPLR